MHGQLERLAERLESRLERSDPGLHLNDVLADTREIFEGA